MSKIPVTFLIDDQSSTQHGLTIDMNIHVIPNVGNHIEVMDINVEGYLRYKLVVSKIYIAYSGSKHNDDIVIHCRTDHAAYKPS